MTLGLKRPTSLGPPRRPRWLAVGLLAIAGCSDSCNESTQQGAIGELGNGDFLYACGGTSDPACEHSADDDVVDYFPECIALGSTFDLEYRLLDDSALELDAIDPVLYVESVNQGFFRGTDDFEALRVGEAAFVVRESQRVLDLIHLAIVEPDGMEVLARDPATPVAELELPVGDTEQLRVFPRSSTCDQLGGAIPITASSSDDAVASTSDGDLVRIQAHAPGTAVVRIGLGALEQQITVHVVGSPVDPDTGDSSSEGTDGSDTDDSTDSGTDGSGSTSDDGGGSSGSSGSSTGGAT